MVAQVDHEPCFTPQETLDLRQSKVAEPKTRRVPRSLNSAEGAAALKYPLGFILGKLRLGAGSQQEPGRHLGPQLGRLWRAAPGADPQVGQWRPRLQLRSFLSPLTSLALVLAQLAWGPFLPPLRSSGLCVSHKGLGAVHIVSFWGRLWWSVQRAEGASS